jgi:hypothetical protein
MDMRTGCVFAAISVLLNVMAATTAFAQDVGTFDQLTLRLASPVTKVLPMEPFIVWVALSNQTTRTIKGLVFLHPSYGFVSFKVARNNGPFEPFQPFPFQDRRNDSRIGREESLAVGYRRAEVAYLSHAEAAELKGGRSAHLFESPGTYRIKAILHDGNKQGETESNVLEVRVDEPTGLNARAYQFLKGLPSEPAYNGFLVNDGASGTAQEKQVEFMKTFPDSRYAGYIRWTLGRAYCKPKEGKDREQGIRLLEQVAADSDEILAVEALQRLSELALQGGDPAKADQYSSVMAKKVSASVLWRELLSEGTSSAQTP